MEKAAQLFDVCIVCALYEEAEAVLSEFSTRCHVSFLKEFSGMDRYEYRYTSILNKRGEPLTVLVTWLSDSGPTQTGLDIKPFLHEFRPRFVAMTGFCAGYKKKVKWGDLIVAQYAYFYEAGKVINESEGLSRHLQEMKAAASTSQILHYTRGFDGWKEPVKKMKHDRLKRQLKNSEEPRCVIAAMASGMAVRQDDPFLWLREHYDRNTVGLDMEAATFYQALRAVSHIHGLVVKGVCDHANMNKRDTYHDYAARASAVYLLTFIQEYVTEQTMPRRDVPPSSKRAASSEVWNVPHARNPYFTGRDELLDQLHRQLLPAEQNNSTKIGRVALTQPQAIKGLGGIGKTQIAVEYAYRSRDQGHYTHTFWVNAASAETIITSFMTIAELLPSFSARNETDQRKLVEAIKRWLEECEQPWLLIFDNVDRADDLPLIQQYLPQRGNGGVLLTTRANAVGSLAASIEVGAMDRWDGTLFLLRRTQLFDHTSIMDASDEEVEMVNVARSIVDALDSFPLALDQAGAYIEETKCDLADYLQLYQDHRKDLLARRGYQVTDYPDSVATTWSLSFQKVEQANPAAAELLRLCAFLAPDAIPEELISNSTLHWSPLLQRAAIDPFVFDQTIAELLKFSLVKRHYGNRVLSIHRLVQAVLIDTMELDVQRSWAERVVLAVNEIFPKKGTLTLKGDEQYRRYLDQAQACNSLLLHYKLPLLEGADLLTRAGCYIRSSSPDTAEPILEHAFEIREQRLEADHPTLASSLFELATSYSDARRSSTRGRWGKAEQLFLRALEIQEQQLGVEHLETAYTLDGLATLYITQGKYAEAEPLLLRSLHIMEQAWGPEDSRLAEYLNGVALFYAMQGKYAEAEPFSQRYDRFYEQEIRQGRREPPLAEGNLEQDVVQAVLLRLRDRPE